MIRTAKNNTAAIALYNALTCLLLGARTYRKAFLDKVGIMFEEIKGNRYRTDRKKCPVNPFLPETQGPCRQEQKQRHRNLQFD
jgi:hypothetical protein